jgi:hypothetical protein
VSHNFRQPNIFDKILSSIDHDFFNSDSEVRVEKIILYLNEIISINISININCRLLVVPVYCLRRHSLLLGNLNIEKYNILQYVVTHPLTDSNLRTLHSPDKIMLSLKKVIRQVKFRDKKILVNGKCL